MIIVLYKRDNYIRMYSKKRVTIVFSLFYSSTLEDRLAKLSMPVID